VSRVRHDDETRSILYDGASVNQLAAMFGLSNTDVSRKLRTLAPSGERSGYPIYKVGEAAAFLVKPRVDIEAYVRKAGVKDLPPALQKDLWAAMNGQLKFEEAQGDVWRTERVHRFVAECFKSVRMSLLLAPDLAEREGRMTPEQYEWFRGLIDRTLSTMHENVVDAMRDMPKLEPGVVDYEADDEAEDSQADEDDEEL
jgi:hypothetical protein